MNRRSHRLMQATAAIACALLAASGTALARGSGDREGKLANLAALLTGQKSPDGANVLSCRPSARHPRPVVLVHGTFNNMRQNWNKLSPQLASEGYCVFALNYGDTSRGISPLKAVGRIEQSAKQLARFVNGVLGTTGASKVDLVGYSQGGLMARQYLRFEGGARRVNALVALAPSNRGTKSVIAQTTKRFAAEMWVVRHVCRSCDEQMWGSALVRKLNQGSMTMPGIDYTVISTRRDGVVVPFTSQRLPAGPRVRNITLQDACPRNRATHLSIPSDPLALGWVRHALDPAGTPPPGCG
jgi:triacylglycerol esterase/lipase EstA (alpha/beta hydrolase family)